MNASQVVTERARDLDTLADLERASAAEIALTGAMLDEAEACSGLWAAVIDRAIADLHWLRDNRGRRLNRHRAGTHNAIMEYDPVEFLGGPGFDAVCQLLGLAPDAVLRGYGIERPALDCGEAA